METSLDDKDFELNKIVWPEIFERQFILPQMVVLGPKKWIWNIFMNSYLHSLGLGFKCEKCNP